MAIQLDIQDSNVGLAAPQAYARIAAVRYDVAANTVEVAVNIYASAQARTDGKSPIDGGVFVGQPGVDMPVLDDTIPGLRAAVYAWLKTLPKFAAGIDV
jgi:hypothetical protein